MKKNLKNIFFKLLFILLIFAFAFPFSACTKAPDYTEYVSELRSNIFLADSDGFSLRIFSVKKESPYISDGIAQPCNERTEVYLVAPQGDKSCQISFTVNGKNYGGEMSFDNVKAEYYYYCPLDTSALTDIFVQIYYGETQVELTAKTVLNKDTLPPFDVLSILLNAEKELFDGLTDKYGFAGEIYIRLIYEDAPYYYVGIIERTGKITAFLINATSGKILAKRKS